MPLTALINISAARDANGGLHPTLLTTATIERQLLNKGAAGLTIHRIVRPASSAVFKWIPSPFADHAADTETTTKGVVVSTPAIASDRMDPRCLQPSAAASWGLDAPQALTVVESRLGDQASATGWQRNMCLTWQSDTRHDSSLQPWIRVTERPLWATPGEEPAWLIEPTNTPHESSRFLPQFIDCWATADKPGAMMIHTATPLWCSSEQNGPATVHPSSPAGGMSRDPQQFLVPPGAALEFLGDPALVPNLVAVGAFDLNVQWKETIATLEIATLKLSSSLEVKYDASTMTYSRA